MPGTVNPCPAEFREQLVSLALAGHSVEDLAPEFKPLEAVVADVHKSPATCLGLFSLKFNLAICEGDVCLSHTCDLGWTDAAKQIQRHRR